MLSRSFIASRTFFSKLPKGIITKDFAGIGNYDSCGTKAKSARKSKECTYHVKSQETPLPECIGYILHANILKKEILTDGMLITTEEQQPMFVIYQIWQEWQCTLKINGHGMPS